MRSFETARTNGFHVKDTDAFLAWANELGVEVERKTELNGLTWFMVFPGEDHEGMFPMHRQDPQTKQILDIDFPGELSEHLCEGETAVLMGCGGDKYHAGGWAVAITWDGRRVQKDLNDIYRAAAMEIGANPEKMTFCEYDGSVAYSTALRGKDDPGPTEGPVHG